MNSISTKNQEFTFVCVKQALPEIVYFQAHIYYAGGIYIPGGGYKKELKYQSHFVYGPVHRDGGEAGAAAQLLAIFEFLWDRNLHIQNMICHEPHTFLTEAECSELLARYLEKNRASS